MPVRITLASRYELHGLLGRGGMGDVYDGWDVRLRRPIAVKVLRPELAEKPDIRQRFESEAHTAATLNHPNVVAVYDSGDDEGTPYIVMERLPGHTLSDEIAAGPMPPQRVRTVLLGVLAGLSAAHTAGILHRDVKPGNVLFTADGVVKVTDFGIAKTAESTQTSTATGEVLGTVAYLSPQRIAGSPATISDDLYAVGVVGYEALAGHRPFDGDNILSVAQQIINQRPRALHSSRSDADPALVEIVERAMAPEPHARFPTADSMHGALLGSPAAPPLVAPMPGPITSTRQFTGVVPPPAHGPPPAPVLASTTPARRNPITTRAAIAAALAVLLVAVFAGIFFTRDDSDPPATTPTGEQSATNSLQTPSPTASTPAVPVPAATTPEPAAPAPTDTPIIGPPADNGNGNGNGSDKKPKEDKGNKN